MNDLKKYFNNFMFVLIGINLSHIIIGAAMGSQGLVVIGAVSLAACGVAVYLSKGSSK